MTVTSGRHEGNLLVLYIQVQVLHISPSVMHQVHTKDKYKYKGKYKYIPAHIAFIQASQQLFFFGWGSAPPLCTPQKLPVPPPSPEKNQLFGPKSRKIFQYFIICMSWRVIEQIRSSFSLFF